MLTLHDSRIEVTDNGEVAVVTFVDRLILDENHSQRIGEDLLSLVGQGGRKEILLNFSRVDYLSSIFLGKLIALSKKVANIHGKLVMCGIVNSVLETLITTRLDRLFNIKENEQAALVEFRAPS